jgi:D-xylose transport system substrate-binding protein
MNRSFKSFAAATAVLMVGVLLGACSSSSSSSSSAPPASVSVPAIAAGDFTSDFAVMDQLKGLAASGTGLVGVLLPDTTTSTRYVQYDAPLLKKAFETAGLTADQFKIDNAQGSTTTMTTQAEADINAGATVLLVDAIDAASGAAIEQNAEAKGVKVIDYDRLTQGGPADRYYVSFNNVQVGQLMGQGLVDCISAWKVSKPNILVMNGAATDNNAKLFAQGYDGVLQPHFDDKSYVKVGEPAGTWDAPTAATTFQQQWTAHPNINALITPNDDNAAAVIAVLQGKQIPANTFPTTGQDASTAGLQDILKGYQCGTVYKPFYAEAQAAAALALYLRAGQTPPASLVDAKTTDDILKKDIASVYTVPVWVTTSSVKDVVADDTAIGIGPTAKDICTAGLQSACTKAGIS